MRKNVGQVNDQLPPSRRRAYTAIIAALPFLIVFITEILLRITGYGGNLDLVVKKQIAGKEYYALNRNVAARYFAQSVAVVPEAVEDDLFVMQKGERTKRIFCLGESTMAGFPYEYSATAVGFLRDRLKTLLPDYNVEVINVGLSAVGSYVVLDFMRELMDYEPDLFIVYVGHNEFYGAYGVGSAVAVKGGAWLTRLTIALLKFKTFLLLRDGYTWLLKTVAGHQPTSSKSLMGEMVAEQVIPYGSELYQDARRIYRDNLTAMITTARSSGVPLMFSTLVSNIRSHEPFKSVFAEGSTIEQQSDWRDLLTEGDSAFVHRLYEAAQQSYKEATMLDTMSASAFYKLGSALYTMGRYSEAKRALNRARDLDALRFRASEEFASELVTICSTNTITLARVDSAFERMSPHGIIGGELVLEHLHPTLDGYFLMAKVLCYAISSSGLLVLRNEWKWELDKTDNEYLEASTVTEFDRAVGRIKVELMMRRWPFTASPTNYEFTPANGIEAVAFRYVQGKIAWSDARYLLAEFHASNKNYDIARKECLAVAKVIPFSYQPLLRVADYYRMEGKNEQARQAYFDCIAAEENPYARFKLGIMLLEEERPVEAAQEFETAFSLDQAGRHKLPLSAAGSGRYLLGVAYAKLGRVPEARNSLQHALAIDPTMADARELLQQLQR